MTRKIHLLVWGFLLPLTGYTQQHTENSVISDFNLDGRPDSLYWEQDFGSGFGSLYYGIYDGASGRSVEVLFESPFSDFIDVIGLSPSLGYSKADWQRVFALMYEDWHTFRRQDGLSWLLRAYAAKVNARDLGDLHQAYLVPPEWVEGPVQTQEFGFQFIEGTALETIRETVWVGGDTDSDLAVIFYYGHNHQARPFDHEPTRREFAFQEGVLQVNKHSILWLQGDRHCWVLAHDRPLFGGPSKLRWPSIVDVHILGDFLLVYIAGAVVQHHHLLLVHPDTGAIGTIYDGTNYESELHYSIRGQKLEIELEEGRVIHDLEALSTDLLRLSGE